MVRIAPSQLLDDLETHRLRAFGVIGAKIDVHESPSVPIGHLSAQAIHIVVRAGDGENRRFEDRRSEYLSGFEIVGNEDAAFHSQTRRMSGDAVRQVASRRTRQHLEPQLDCAGGGDRHDPILVGQRRMVDRIVFDIQLAYAQTFRQTIAADERRKA